MKALTVDLLARVVPCSYDRAELWLPHLVAAMDRYDIDTLDRVAAFLAQVSYESARLTRIEENLNYTAQRLCVVWPRRFPTLASAVPFAHAPEKLANLIYAGRMGNGEPLSGDGWRYRGRGLIQLTGRDNYRRIGDMLGVDLVSRPELLLQEQYAALSAGAYWCWKRCNALVDAGDFKGVTRAINGGLHGHEDGNTTGLDDRVELYEHARKVLA